MCGKPLPTGFRTVHHSDTVCRILFGPETARFRRRFRPNGNHLFSVITVEGPIDHRHTNFGRFLRVVRRAVPVPSPYACQKASWLVPANIKAVTQVSDLVIIPTRPSPHDLRAVGATVDLVESTKKPMLFIVNGAANRARITADAAVALSQHGTVSPVTIFQARGLCGEHDRRSDGRRARPQIQISFRNYRIMELRKSAAS